MFQYFLYFLIAFGATTAGSMTGMGGGVIIKPLLALLILGVFLYMRNKDKIQSLALTGLPMSLLAGLLLASAPPFWGSAAGPSTSPSSSICLPILQKPPLSAP